MLFKIPCYCAGFRFIPSQPKMDLYTVTTMKLISMLLIFAASCSVNAAEFLDVSSLQKELAITCHSQKSALVLFITKKEMEQAANDADNEFYADWSYYLNSNLEVLGSDLTVIFTSVDVGRQLLISTDSPKNIYSMLYVPCSRQPLYIEEPILESYHYKYLRAYKDGASVTFSELMGIDLKANNKPLTPSDMGFKPVELLP